MSLPAPLPWLLLTAALAGHCDPACAQFDHPFGTRVEASFTGRDVQRAGDPYQTHAYLFNADARHSAVEAEADSRDGALHVYAYTEAKVQPDCDPRVNTRCTWYATGSAKVWDVLTFRREDLSDPSQIKWRFNITGQLTEGWSSPYGKFGYYVGTHPDGWSAVLGHSVQPGAVVAGSLAMPNQPGATLSVYVMAFLTAWAGNGGIADFSHTARFDLELPDGVSFTSASGVFMADHFPPPPTPVPEPANGALLGAGLLGLFGRHRLGRR